MKIDFENPSRVFILFLILGFFSYGASLWVPFLFDDMHTLAYNPSVKSLSNIFNFWHDPTLVSIQSDNQGYRPMLYFFFSLCWFVGNGGVWAFHIFKILLLVGLVFGAYLSWCRLLKLENRFFREIGLPIPAVAFCVAVLWLVHPALTEVSVYISATSTLQCAFFYAWGYYFYLRFRESENDRKSALFCAVFSLFLFSSSGFTKEEGLTFPAIVALTEIFYFKRRVFSKSVILTVLMYGICALAVAGVIFHFMPASADRARGQMPRIEYLYTQFRAWLWYMKLWFLPAGLNADNLEFQFSTSFLEPRVLLSFFGNLGILALGLGLRKKHPLILFGLLWYYIAILPASSVVPLAEPVNERRMIHAYLGFTPAAMIAVLALVNRIAFFKVKKNLLVAFSVICALLWIATEFRVYTWSDRARIWQDTVDKNPDSGRARNNLALVYMDRGEYEPALKLIEDCIRIRPYYSVCRINHGYLLDKFAKYEEADAEFKKAIELDPLSPYPKHYYADFQSRLHNDTAAYTLYLEADALYTGKNPEVKKALLTLGKKLKVPETVLKQRELEIQKLLNP